MLQCDAGCCRVCSVGRYVSEFFSHQVHSIAVCCGFVAGCLPLGGESLHSGGIQCRALQYVAGCCGLLRGVGSPCARCCRVVQGVAWCVQLGGEFLKSWLFKCNMLQGVVVCCKVEGGEDPYDALSCRTFFAKEPLIIGLFCGK